MHQPAVVHPLQRRHDRAGDPDPIHRRGGPGVISHPEGENRKNTFWVQPFSVLKNVLGPNTICSEPGQEKGSL